MVEQVSYWVMFQNALQEKNPFIFILLVTQLTVFVLYHLQNDAQKAILSQIKALILEIYNTSVKAPFVGIIVVDNV